MLIKQPACLKCGKQLEDERQEYCSDCMRKTHVFDRGAAVFSYTDAMKKSMYAFKYNNRREYAGFYAANAFKEYGNYLKIWAPQAIIPVPLHKSRYRKRGYNQAQVFAKELSRMSGIPMDENMLVRVKNTRPQKELDDKERVHNLNNAFQIMPDSVKYSSVLLTDDIYTTGTTIDECARVLKDYGVSNVYFLTVCIGRGF